MKSSKKVLAFALAAAMVVTAVPATNAQAAAKTAKLSSKTVTVAVGSAKKQTKSIKVVTPSNWKNVKVKVSSSNKKVATVKATGKTVKVTGVKKGTAKVTVKVTAKKGKKPVKKTLSAKATVINAGLKFTSDVAEVNTGATLDLGVKKSPKAAKLTCTSSDEAVATVKDGVVTGVKAGKATITVTSDYGKTIKKDVTVKDTVAQLTAVKQTASNAFTATFSADASKTITKDDFKVVATDGSQEIAVKSLAFAADGKSADVTLFKNFTDKTAYKITCKTAESTLTAEIGDVTKVEITTASAQLNVETPVEFKLKNANGIDITPAADADAHCTVEITGDYAACSTATPSKATITMNEVGKTADVTVTYNSNKAGAQAVSATAKILCVEAVARDGGKIFTVNPGTRKLKNDPDNKSAKFYLPGIASDSAKVAIDKIAQVYFCATDEKNAAKVISYDSYEVESANDAIASATVDSSYAAGKYAIIKISGNSVGSTQLNVTAKVNGKASKYTIPVTVYDPLKAATIDVTLDRTQMSNVKDDEYYGKLTAKLLDENKNEVRANYEINVIPNVTSNGSIFITKTTESVTDSHVNNPTAGKDDEDVFKPVNAKEVKVWAQNADAKTYTIAIKASDVKTGKTFEKKVTVTVGDIETTASKAASGLNVSYGIEFRNAKDDGLANKIDVNPVDTNDDAVYARLYATYNGLFAGYVRNGGSQIASTGTNVHAKNNITKIQALVKYGTENFNEATGNVDLFATAPNTYNSKNATLGNLTSTSVKVVGTPGGTVTYNVKDQTKNINVARSGNYVVEYRIYDDATDSDKYTTKTRSLVVDNTAYIPKVDVTTTTLTTTVTDTNIKDVLTTTVDMNNNKSEHESITAANDFVAGGTTTKQTLKTVTVTDKYDADTWYYVIPVNRTFIAK